MQTVTLKIEDNIYEKFKWLLTHFSEKEVKVLDENKYLNDYDYLKSIKGMEESLIQASKEPIDTFVSENELEW